MKIKKRLFANVYYVKWNIIPPAIGIKVNSVRKAKVLNIVTVIALIICATVVTQFV